MADRLIAWLDECGYEIVERGSQHTDASLVPTEPKSAPEVARTM